jgi:hypothetical protein
MLNHDEDEEAEGRDTQAGPYARKTRKLQADQRTLSMISILARIQCTQREAADVLGVGESTLPVFLKTTPPAREAWELGLKNRESARPHSTLLARVDEVKTNINHYGKLCVLRASGDIAQVDRATTHEAASVRVLLGI